MIDEALLDELERYLAKLHEYQVAKAARVAREHNKHLTDEDLLNPDNFTYLVTDPRYTYEDGMAAGILAAKIATRAFLKDKCADKSQSPVEK